MKKKQPGSERLKNPKHELFCWLYAGYNNRDLFGNGTRCYIIVYHQQEIEVNQKKIDDLMGKRPKGYSVEVDRLEQGIRRMENNARSRASMLISKRDISHRLDFLLDALISDETMDRELAFTAAQRYDLNSKVQAIKEYNRVKDRGAAGRLEGLFTFAWEDVEEKGVVAKKKPIIKKATVKGDDVTEWE